MKRKMVIIGISYILGLFFASFFIDDGLWIIAIISIAILGILILFKTVTLKVAITSAISFFVGLFIYSGYTVNHYTPVISLEGESTVFVGMVKSVDEYAGEYASYILDGVFENGTEASVLCYTDNYDCRYGDYMRVRGSFSIPEKTYLYDSTEYYRGMSVFLEADSDCNYTVLYTNDHQLVRKVQNYRDKLQSRIYALCGQTGGSLTVAMIFGNRQGLDERIESAFYHAGIGPILALSGFHLILFSGLCNVVGNRTRLQRIMQFIMTIVMTGLFSLVAMWPISVLRAGMMLLVSRGACIFCRKSDSLSALFISVIILTIMNPYLIHNVGFLLSVAGTFGVNSFAPWITEKIPLNGWLGGILKTAVSAGLITICTMPICIHFFSKTSLLSPVSNVIFAPMCVIIMLLGIVIFFLGGEGFICTMCGDAINAVSNLLSDGLLWMQSNILFAFPSGFESLSEAVIIMSGMTAAVFIITKKQSMVMISVLLSIAILFSGKFILTKRFEKELRVFVLGRNKGQVIVVTYDGRTDVIDLVYDSKNANHLKNFLDEYGISSIDCMYLTNNVNAAAAAYDMKLSAIEVDTVLLASGAYFGENNIICRQLPDTSDFCKITASEYEIFADDSELIVSACGKILLVSQFDKLQSGNYYTCDYLVAGDSKGQAAFAFAQNGNWKLLCSGHNIEVIMNDNESVYARRLY